MLVIHVLTGLGHLALAWGLSLFVPWWLSLALCAGLWWLSAKRLFAPFNDRKRPRWIALLVDEPLSAHWSATLLGSWLALLALPFWPASGAVIALAAYGLGLLVTGWAAFIRRRLVKRRRVEVELSGLPAQFHGYRIAHLSDLHVGSHDPKSVAQYWARITNELDPDLTVVTGDLVRAGTDFYDDVAEALSELRAKDGVLVTMGNHDQWDNGKLLAALEGRGLVVLQNTWRKIQRLGAELVIVGLDDRSAGKADLELALDSVPAGLAVVLLSHYPDYFESAAERGVALTLSGHTHGGQIGLPFLADRFNLARLTRQRSRGVHTLGASRLYVNAGLGTTGPPLRLGIPPEVALIELRCV
jgi:uncharacterized protein